MKYPNTVNLDTLIERIRKDKRVLSVEKNEIYRLTATIPADPFYSNGNASNPAHYQWGLHALNFENAWDFSKGHAYLGALDTGIDTDHADLQENYKPHLSKHVLTSSQNVATSDDNIEDTLGHGTHVSGILAATSDNNFGVAGSCWHCSLAMIKMQATTTSIISRSIDHLANIGVQAINMSLTQGWMQDQERCATAPYQYGSVCLAINKAVERDIVLVASAGNRDYAFGSPLRVGFPAINPNVISVGGIQFDPTSSNPTIDLWDELTTPDIGSAFTPNSMKVDLVAPAKDVLSTMIPGKLFNSQYRCGDSYGPTNSLGYGTCTGTSMSAPHITGLAGLIKSANPLLSRDAVKTIMTNHGSTAHNRTTQMGYGVPDAELSVKEAMGSVNGLTLKNRLTPLFAFYINSSNDSFYTTVPQMARAAINLTNCNITSTYGSTIPGYDEFPGAASTPCSVSNVQPKAEVYLFTTDNHPTNSNQPDLVPLYRLLGPITTPPSVEKHVYALKEEINGGSFNGYNIVSGQFNGYVVEGIEGYIYPMSYPTNLDNHDVRLVRAYKSSVNDRGIFPDTSIPNGYVIEKNLGYVYPNVDTDHDGLIDGFESILQTNIYNANSDSDGFTDGEEIGRYPYTDPLNATSRPKAHIANVTGVNHLWKTVSFPAGYEGSVVIAGPPSFNDTQPGVVRLRKLNKQNFQLRFKEWNYLPNAAHGSEEVSVLVMKKGRYYMPDGKIWEVGSFPLSNFVDAVWFSFVDGVYWKPIKFSSPFPNTPKLFLTAQTANGGQAVTVRVREMDESGFKAGLFEQESFMRNVNIPQYGHLNEEAGYLAIYDGLDHGTPSPSTGLMPTGTGTANISYQLTSQFVGSESSPSNIWTNVFGTEYRIEEEQSWDAETHHLSEKMSELKIGSGHFAQDTTSTGGNTAAIRKH